MRSCYSRWFFLFVLTCGCGSAGAREGSPGFPDSDTRRRGAIPVREIAVSDPEASFTAVDALAVDSRGLVYVPDTYQQRVTVLGADGTVLRAFGRRGSGPGEFRSVRSVQVLPGDSVLTYDPSLSRVSIFPPGSDHVAYSVTLGTRGPVPFDVRRTPDNSAFIALFRPDFAFVPGADFSGRKDHVRLLSLDGSPVRELVTFPSKAFLVAQNSIMPHPFGHEGFARLDSKNRLHFVWSDSLAAAEYDLDGRRVGGFAVPYSAPEITRQDHADALAAIPGVVRARFTTALQDSLHERWPAVREVIVDDRDRIWMALGGNTRQGTEWATFSTDGTYLGSVLVPTRTDIRVVRGNFLYGSRMDDDDVAVVVVYELRRPLR
jgi:hypothetical protein